MKKFFIGVLAVLSLGILSGCHIHVSVDGAVQNYKDSKKYEAGNFTYEADQVKKVEIYWVSGEVQLVQSSQSQLCVSENGDSLEEEQQLHYYLDGHTLKIQYCRSGYRGKIDGRDKQLRAEIPEGIRLEVKSVSADIYAEEVTAEELDINTVSGDMEIGVLNAEFMEAGTVSGDGIFGFAHCEEGKFDSVSGSVEIALLNDRGMTLKFSTVSGEIRTNQDYTVRNKKNIFGSGFCKMDVDTVSGDVKVR